MSKKSEPKITSKSLKGDYVQVSFKPDLARFKMVCLDEQIVSLFKKRVYDIAGTASKSVAHWSRSRFNDDVSEA